MNTLLIACLLLSPPAAPPERTRVPLDQLPKPVLEAVRTRYADAKMVAATKESPEGKALYAIALDNKGQKVQVTIRPDGTLIATAKEIAIRDLPADVVRTVRSKYPKEALEKAAEEKRGDKISYAVLLDTGTGTPYEVVLDPQGRVLREGWRPGR
jgi:hypothetical protein